MILEQLNIALSAAAALGLGYLLLSGKYAVAYPVFFRRVLAGLTLYAVTGAVTLVYAAPALHLVHGASALFVAAGCYSLVVTRLGPDEAFEVLEA